MLSIATNPVSANTALQADRTPEIHITPNPLRRGTPITFQVNGIPLGTRMAVTVTNIVGNRIHIEEIRASPSATLTLATEGLPAGIYLISFSCPRHNITRRLTITQ